MRLAGSRDDVCAGVCLPTVAHHSHGNYTDKTIDVEGVVKEVVLVVPHSFVYIKVKKGDAAETWVLEGTSRSGLEKIGVTRDYLKAGERSRRAVTHCVMAPPAVCSGT